MLVFLWAYVVMAAFFPGGEQIMRHQASAFQAQIRAQLETSEAYAAPVRRPGLAVGAAAHFAR